MHPPLGQTTTATGVAKVQLDDMAPREVAAVDVIPLAAVVVLVWLPCLEHAVVVDGDGFLEFKEGLLLLGHTGIDSADAGEPRGSGSSY